MRGKRKTRGARRSREQWAALLAEQAQSGLSREAFCSSRGLVLSTFANAKRRLREAADTAGSGEDFVALSVESPTPQSVAPAWDVELSLGADVVLRIRSV